jgi:hypothetical protein
MMFNHRRTQAIDLWHKMFPVFMHREVEDADRDNVQPRHLYINRSEYAVRNAPF